MRRGKESNMPTLYYYAVVGFLILLIGAYKGYQMWVDLQPNTLRVRIITIEKTVLTYTIRTKGIEFENAGKRYRIIPDRIYRTGKLRVPTAYYKENVPDPLDLLTTPQPEIDAKSYYLAIYAHVARDIILAFTESLSQMQLFIILIVLMLLGFGAVYWTLGNKIDDLATIVQTLIPTPTSTPPPINGGPK